MNEDNELRGVLYCVAAVVGPIAGALFAYFKLPKRVGLISVAAVFAAAWSGVAFGRQICERVGLFGHTADVMEAISSRSLVLSIGLGLAWVLTALFRTFLISRRRRAEEQRTTAHRSVT